MAPYLKNKTNLKDLIITYYLALLPLIGYGLYKNTILLKQFKILTFINFCKPILILLVGLLAGILVEFIYQRFIVKDSFKNYNPFIPLTCLITAMLLPFKVNLIILFITLVLFLTIIKLLKLDDKLNIGVLLVLILILVFQLFKLSSFCLPQESNLNLTFLDMFIGRNPGGLFSTSNFWLIISYFILSRNIIYKKEIPFYIIITNIICLGIYTLITNNYDGWLLFLSGFNLFASIFLAPYTYPSCYTPKGKVLMGILIGLISFLLNVFLKWYFGIFLAIFMVSLVAKYLDNLGNKPKNITEKEQKMLK